MAEPETTRAVHRPVTDEDKQMLDAALEKTQGNRAHAARVLGWDVSRVYNILNDHADMKAKWGRYPAQPPSGPLAEVDRPPPDAPMFSPDEEKAALAIAKQDALMARSWKKLGLDDQQQEFLRTLQNSYALNLRSTIDLTYGGMIHTATRLLLLFEDLIVKIKHIDDNPEEYNREHNTEFGTVVTKTAHEHRCELYDRLISVASEMRKVNSDATKAQYVRAQLEALRSGGTKGGKPGWGKGAPPVSVTVNAKGSAEVTVGAPDPAQEARLVGPE